ncbi:MAG TPA: 5-oxoprolinase subunit PxpA [Saprospiraceae bacterium]|nr:5-oxoprolinase subunit PxpA [Saprospiraceae bacterium]HMQ84975.1 5-oxoprolinase subunit PxpA [Saprospiraceae bacterium]
MPTIDINCDLGESFVHYAMGNDEAVFPFITSCNVACGFHGGDPLHIENTIRKALTYGINIGAHPSYPDLQGFGRRPMKIAPEELKALLKYQIAAVKGLTESLGGRLKHVKPHGALYNAAAVDEWEAECVLEAVAEMDGQLILLGMAGSVMEEMAHKRGMPFIAEAFADRAYTAAGLLKSRKEPDSVIFDPHQAAHQVLNLVERQEVRSDTGAWVTVKAQSICLHGDNPNVVAIVQTIHLILSQNSISISPF